VQDSLMFSLLVQVVVVVNATEAVGDQVVTTT
jgi:hypothetical protein